MADLYPVGASPATQPKVKTEIEKRYDEAGFARNRAELAYKNAVKEHGANSVEAKAAKETLTVAQANVDAIRKEITGGGRKTAAKHATPKEPLQKPDAWSLKTTRFTDVIKPQFTGFCVTHCFSELFTHRSKFGPLFNDKASQDFTQRIKKK